ncbi:hypothetical protein COCSADRAFT_29913 [Bipolaris sorokiniana ND90Pr]|uniref:Rhodopsin domain-containing protein n=1 Tax=Cochliobolus sativus (strain ND90Pr / ATCC 201652) TaxID=665912 RepID=M2SV87_COCSN|nr:uncharacterized protein COCSADRAFT_29913 [Bipolaris sorokiniana ND90Pr]EMD60722.1 hypothetical protein COCSADRAFT_29913 [Bipolaris sorokiniana ND90Pr]
MIQHPLQHSSTPNQPGKSDPGPELRNTTIALLVLASIFVALRFAARLKRGLTYGADDWMIMFSLLTLGLLKVQFVCFVTGGLSYATIHWGLGSHAITLPLDNITVVLKCNPIKKAWLGSTINGTCIELKASFIGNAVPNISTDIAILVLFASAYRFATIMQFDIADTTGTLAMACTWCVVGVASGIISACLPTLHPFMLIISSQFSNIRNQSDKGSATERQSSKTQLVTIGGTGSKRNQDFERLKDDYEVHCDFVATYTHGSRDDALLSRHKSPLAAQSARKPAQQRAENELNNQLSTGPEGEQWARTTGAPYMMYKMGNSDGPASGAEGEVQLKQWIYTPTRLSELTVFVYDIT